MIYNYLQFLNENFYDDFKSKYAKLFNDSDKEINNQLGELFKKIDDETDYLKVINIFDDFLSVNQNLLNNKIEISQGKETINKLLSDNLKTIYFALKATQIKINNKNFSDIFENSKDKNFQNLMSMQQDKFSDAVPTYVNDYLIPQIEKMSNTETQTETQTEKTNEEAQSVQPVQSAQPQQDKQLQAYKDSSKEWFNYVYGMIWDKVKTTKNEMTTNRLPISNIDQLIKTMTNSNNTEAKKQLLTKITTLSKADLNKLGNILNLNLEEIGEF